MSQFLGKNSKVEVTEARRGKKEISSLLCFKKEKSCPIQVKGSFLNFFLPHSGSQSFCFVFPFAKTYIINCARKLPCIALVRLGRVHLNVMI